MGPYTNFSHHKALAKCFADSRWGMYDPCPGRLNVGNDELDEMMNEASGPINFTVFLTMFGEKLKGLCSVDTKITRASQTQNIGFTCCSAATFIVEAQK